MSRRRGRSLMTGTVLSAIVAANSISGARVPVSNGFNCDPGCPSIHGHDRGGEVTITVMEATGVEDTDGWGPFAGLPDPYIQLKLDGITRQTEPVSDSLSPVWPGGGEDLWLGAQVSGTQVSVLLWDQDEGLEFDDDLIATADFNIMDCSCFTDDIAEDAVCEKKSCNQESWIPLREGENCEGRDSWPWAATADPEAMCLRLRQTVVPHIITVHESFRELGVTTAGVQTVGGDPIGGTLWGRMYQGNSDTLDTYTSVDPVAGSLLLRTGASDYNLRYPGTYVSFSSNLNATVHVFRYESDFDQATPSWLTEPRWQETKFRVIALGSTFESRSTDVGGGEELSLGFAGAGLPEDVDNAYMYIVSIAMTVHVDQPELPYRTEFQKDAFWPIILEMLALTLPFALIQLKFLRRIGWRIDRIESGILQSAAKDEKTNLIALVFKPIYQNGSKANIDFRRNLYFVTLGAKILLLVPIAIALSCSLAMAFLSVPSTAGLGVFCIGIGTGLIVYSFLTWERSGWRMNRARLIGFGLGFSSFYIFLFLSVGFDMRVTDAGMPFSIFSLTCVAFTLNSLPMIAVFFLDNDQLHQAFSQMQKVTDKNAAIAGVKNKVQALGAMGLKMALLSNKMRAEQSEQKAAESEAKTKRIKGGAFGTLLGAVFTVDDKIPEFRYTDTFRRWFGGGKRHRRRLTKNAYLCSLAILFAYSLLVYFKCDVNFKTQGFGLSFNVAVLDMALFALLRGPCAWDTGKYVSLTFGGRAVLAFFSGESWLVGVGLAYLIYGSALGVEIINQRMQTFSSDRAGAIAYFGQGLGKKKRKNDVAAMPEFVLGVLSFFFLVAMLAYVFTKEDAEIPTVSLVGQEWKVWIFGVAAFVVVTVTVILGLAKRALLLEREGLMHSKIYLYKKWMNLPLQLVMLAELMVVVSGLLIYAMTDSTFVFVSAVFWPVILGCCMKVYTHWVSNDFRVFENPQRRAPGLDSEEESEEEDGLDFDDEDDDDDHGEGNIQRKKKDDDDEEDDDTEEDSEEEDALGAAKQALVANIGNLNKKLADGFADAKAKRGKIGLPKVNFRKPMNHGTKDDREFEDSDEEEEEEKKEKEAPDVAEQCAADQVAVKPEPNQREVDGCDDASEFKPLLELDKCQNASESDKRKSKRERKLRMREMRMMPKKATCPTPSELKARTNAKVATKVKGCKTGMRKCGKRLDDWIRPKVLKFLQISGESDPVLMSDMEALYHGKLTRIDYSMLRAMTGTSLLIILYGIVLSFTEGGWAHSVWFSFFFLVLSFVPVRKYYGTQRITPDMVRCFKASIAMELIGSIILFVDVIGYSVTHPVTLWLLLGLFLWPALLGSVVIVMIWRDSEWKIEPRVLRWLERCFKLFLFASLIGFVFTSAKAGFVMAFFTCAGFVGIRLLQAWSTNAYYLPLRYQYLVSTGFNVMALFFAFLAVILTNNEGVFFCLSIAFLCVAARLGTELLSELSTLSRSTPLYFSTFIFPIYSLSPGSDDVVDRNKIGVLMYKLQFVILLWGASCLVFVDPLDVGVGIMSAAFVLMVTMTSYLVSRTPLWMASATLCVDEKELKASAAQARAIFETRRNNFEIVCDEYETRDKEEANMRQGLDKYRNWETKRSKVIEFEKRYSAREMVAVVHKAQDKLILDRLGKPRRDRVLDFSLSMKDAFFTGKGPFAPFALGGMLPWLYHAYKSPLKSRKQKGRNTTKRKASYKVHPGDEAGEGKMILDGPVDFGDSDDEEQEFDQLDRLIDELGPGGDVLKIYVKDWDLTSANDDLGFIEIDLDELEPDEIHTEWHDLETEEKYVTKEKMQATGRIQVQVELANVFGEGDEALQVRVCVLRARGLRAADSGGTSDPFCVVECGAFNRRTAVVHKTLDPDWTESRGGGRMTFPPVDDTLQIEIRDKDLLTSDFLGGVDIHLPDLIPNEELITSYDLEGGYGKTRATGSVKLALLVTGNAVSEYGLVESKSTLHVTVVSAKGLRAADRGGTSDPFCVVKCGMDAFSTSVVAKTLTPKWQENYTFNADPGKKSRGGVDDENAVENVELLDCWKVYQQLPNLDAAMAKEYYEEMRANALFQMFLVVASKGRKDKESILFQRFLREYRFKLLANKIEPPRNIFKSKSWATIDVGLVALWLLRLTPEQRDRFYALKQVFAREVQNVEERRMVEDDQLAEHARTLEEWQRQHDWEKGCKQLEDFRQRKIKRERLGTKSGATSSEEEPEIVVNAREMLHEIVQGPNVKTVKLDPKTGAKGPLRMFHDPAFPSNEQAMAGTYNAQMVAGWKLAREVNGQVELFQGGTDPDDIFQGILHNGWFLSALVILSASGSVGDEEVDPLIDNLFISKSRNDLGAYAVRLYKNSQWELVIVDESFPILSDRFASEDNGGVACSHSLKFEEMWVSILEKAYAKYYHGYAMLENGYVHHALKTLTGYDSEQIFLLKGTQGPARLRLWEKLMKYRLNGFLMGCGTIQNNSANAEQLDSGLMFGACYAIFQVREVDGHRLLQLRNPPGATGEWKGDWGDNSALWTTRLKKKLGWTDDEDDGTFWMSFADFCLSFSSLYVCRYYDPNIWRHVQLRGAWDSFDKTDAGLPSKHNPDCKLYHNPQWAINVERPTDLHVKISQTLPDGSMASDPQPMCAMLLRTDATRMRHVRRARFISRGNMAGWTGKPDRSYEKHINESLDPGIYILLVATYASGCEGPFSVHIDSSFELGVTQIYPRPAESEIVKTETAVKEVKEPTSRTGKIAARFQTKMDQMANWVSAKKEKVEIFTEKKVEQLEAAMVKHFGMDIDTVLDVVRQDDDSDEEDEGYPEAAKAGADDRFVSKRATVDIANILEDNPEPQEQEQVTASEPRPEAASQPTVQASEWVKQYDPNSGNYYYWSTVTNETTWEEPAGFTAGARSPELESATKIQAAFRGRKSRRQL